MTFTGAIAVGPEPPARALGRESKRTSPVVKMRSAYAFLGSMMQLVVIWG